VALRQGEALAAPPRCTKNLLGECAGYLVMADSRQKAPLLIDEKHLLLALLGLSGSYHHPGAAADGVSWIILLCHGRGHPGCPGGKTRQRKRQPVTAGPHAGPAGQDVTREASEGKLDAILWAG
jgi:hypothetical protein